MNRRNLLHSLALGVHPLPAPGLPSVVILHTDADVAGWGEVGELETRSRRRVGMSRVSSKPGFGHGLMIQ